MRIKFPIFIILAILTLYPSLMLDLYQDAGKELLQNPDCLNSCQSWTVHSPGCASIHNENGIVTLESTGNGKTVQIRQTVVPAGERIRLQAELTCDGVRGV